VSRPLRDRTLDDLGDDDIAALDDQCNRYGFTQTPLLTSTPLNLCEPGDAADFAAYHRDASFATLISPAGALGKSSCDELTK